MKYVKETKKRRDSVTFAILFVIYIVIYVIFGFMGAFGAAVWMVSPVFMAFFSAPVLVLMMARIPRNGPLAVITVFFAIFLFLHGMTWIMSAVTLAIGAAAELVFYLTGFTSPKSRVATCTAFNVMTYMMIGSLVFYRDEFAARIESQMGAGYANDFMALASNEVLIALFFAVIVAAFLGALVGNRLVERHFKRAGVV